jgi:hypothetical protein
LAWITYVGEVTGAGIDSCGNTDLLSCIADGLGKAGAVRVALALSCLLVDEKAACRGNEEKSEQEPKGADDSRSRNAQWRR